MGHQQRFTFHERIVGCPTLDPSVRSFVGKRVFPVTDTG